LKVHKLAYPYYKLQLFYPLHILSHLLGPPSLTLSCHSSDLKVRSVVCAKTCFFPQKGLTCSHYIYCLFQGLTCPSSIGTLILHVNLFVFAIVLGGVFSIFVSVCSCNWLYYQQGILNIMGTLYLLTLTYNLAMSNWIHGWKHDQINNLCTLSQKIKSKHKESLMHWK